MTDHKAIPDGLPEWLAPHTDEVSAWGPAPSAPTCWVEGCQRDAHLHGLCKTHHLRATRTWHPRPSHRSRKRAKSGSAAQPQGQHDLVPGEQGGGAS